jgi:hypothetical protein
MKCGREPEYQSGDERDAERESQNAPVNSDVDRAWNVVFAECNQQIGPPHGQQQTDRSAQ